LNALWGDFRLAKTSPERIQKNFLSPSEARQKKSQQTLSFAPEKILPACSKKPHTLTTLPKMEATPNCKHG